MSDSVEQPIPEDETQEAAGWLIPPGSGPTRLALRFPDHFLDKDQAWAQSPEGRAEIRKWLHAVATERRDEDERRT